MLRLSRQQPTWTCWQAGFEARGLWPLLIFTTFHHMQYFTYVYAIVAYAVRQFDWPGWSPGAFLLLGWIGYSLVEGGLQRWRPWIISGGHLLNALALVALLPVLSHDRWLVALWIALGVFGGTAFAANRLPGLDDRATKGSRNVAEHIGHVVGALLGGILATFDLSIAILIAAGMSAIAAVALLGQRPLAARPEEEAIPRPPLALAMGEDS